MQDIESALIALQEEGAKPGAAWQRAHQLAQGHEGEPAYDRLHALVHRIEGDAANAAYWYRRAAEPVFTGDLMDEIELLIERHRS
ncbi:MAG: hypothetical protein HC871_00210 [Rhizobiales bacterium]|nr:hypothetical protein [Hyphomicrobiales bacterium]